MVMVLLTHIFLIDQLYNIIVFYDIIALESA